MQLFLLLLVGLFFFKWHTGTEHLVKEWYGKYVQYYEDDVDLYRGPHSKRWTALTLSDRTGRGGVAHWHSRNGPVDPVERHQQARRWLRGEDKWRWLEPTCRAGPVIATTSLKSFPCHWFLPLCWNSLRTHPFHTKESCAFVCCATLHVWEPPCSSSRLSISRIYDGIERWTRRKKKERKQNEGTHLYAPATHRYIL